MSDTLMVFVSGLISGGFAIPAGFLLDLPPLVTYLAACAGSIAGLVVFAFAGSGLRRWIVARMGDAEEGQEKGARLLGSWGVRGLGLVGPIFPGVTISVLAGLAAGVDRGELVRWMTIGIVGLFGLYTIGLVILIAVTGI